MLKNGCKISNYLIMPNFQTKYIFRFAYASFLIVLVNYLIMKNYIVANFEFMEVVNIVTDLNRDIVEGNINNVLNSVLIYSVIIEVLILIFGVFISHKIAGPIFRFKSSFDKVCEGEQNI